MKAGQQGGPTRCPEYINRECRGAPTWAASVSYSVDLSFLKLNNYYGQELFIRFLIIYLDKCAPAAHDDCFVSNV